jgi:hypothetical protein
VIVAALAVLLAVAVPSPSPAAGALAPPGSHRVLRADIDATTSVFAFAGPRSAAFVLHFSGGVLRELPHGAISIRELGPHAGATYQTHVVQIAAEFSAPAAIVQAGLWIDGKAVPGQPHGTKLRFSAFGASPRLGRGAHTAVAFAEAGGTARAVVWSFRVR